MPRLQLVLTFLLASMFARAAPPAPPPPQVIHYLAGQKQNDTRFTYYWDLLAAALKATDTPRSTIVAQATDREMSLARAESEVASGGMLDVMARTTSQSLESHLLPIRIPLDKGLTGFRIFAVREDMQASFSAVNNLDDLRKLRIGLGRSWADVPILRNAGLTVVEGEDYAGLFRMLRAGRFDGLSRGVNEIGEELRQQGDATPKLVMERHLLLYYPLPRYFFVSRTPQGQALAARITEGLRRLEASGEFEQRYRAYKKAVLANLALHGRTLIRIPNPTLSPETPLGDASAWDDLSTELK
ncbi:MAG: hypothetical protein JO142_20430 [Burkholderiales bacterium]|nr:hypothetical protein [Burkholderiales bacterium]